MKLQLWRLFSRFLLFSLYKMLVHKWDGLQDLGELQHTVRETFENLIIKKSYYFLDRGRGTMKYFWEPTFLKATWQQALSLCQGFGLQLASFDSKAEEDNFLLSKSQMVASFLYIGAFGTVARSSSNANWVWVSTGRPISYALNWASGEPNNANSAQRCLAITWQSNTYRYDDSFCIDRGTSSFLCQSIETTT